MKKLYEKPKFSPITLEANILAGCVFTNNWGWTVCPIDVDGTGMIMIFSDEGHSCNFGPDVGISICDHAPDNNSNTFGS